MKIMKLFCVNVHQNEGETYDVGGAPVVDVWVGGCVYVISAYVRLCDCGWYFVGAWVKAALRTAKTAAAETVAPLFVSFVGHFSNLLQINTIENQ